MGKGSSGKKNMNKRDGQPKRKRYRTEQRYKTNAIGNLEKHLRVYDKKGNDKQAIKALEGLKNG